MAKLKVEWANSRALKAKIRPERDDLSFMDIMMYG